MLASAAPRTPVTGAGSGATRVQAPARSTSELAPNTPDTMNTCAAQLSRCGGAALTLSPSCTKLAHPWSARPRFILGRSSSQPPVPYLDTVLMVFWPPVSTTVSPSAMAQASLQT